MRRSLPFSLVNSEEDGRGQKKMVLALSRVEAGLDQVAARHVKLLRMVKDQEKEVTDMLEQLSERQAATLRILAVKEEEINKKLEELSRKQEEIIKKIG